MVAIAARKILFGFLSMMKINHENILSERCDSLRREIKALRLILMDYMTVAQIERALAVAGFDRDIEIEWQTMITCKCDMCQNSQWEPIGSTSGTSPK